MAKDTYKKGCVAMTAADAPTSKAEPKAPATPAKAAAPRKTAEIYCDELAQKIAAALIAAGVVTVKDEPKAKSTAAKPAAKPESKPATEEPKATAKATAAVKPAKKPEPKPDPKPVEKPVEKSTAKPPRVCDGPAVLPVTDTAACYTWEGPGRAYCYRDYRTGKLVTKSDIWAVKQASGDNYTPIWVWYKEGKIDHVLDQDELNKYCP